MSLRVSQLLVVVMVVLAFSVAAWAQDHEPIVKISVFSVSVGDRAISIPPPEGFEEASSQFQRVKARFEATEAPQNDVLAVHLPTGDCNLARRGERPTFEQYTKVSVLRAGRQQSITPAFFAHIVSEFRKNDSTYLDMDSPKMQEMFKQWDRELSKLESKDLKLDLSQPRKLGEFDVRQNVYSLMLLMNLNVGAEGQQTTIPMLASMTYLLVKDKVIFVYTYKRYHSRTDVATLKDFTTKWNNSILAAN